MRGAGLEFLHAAGSVDHLILSGVEGVAVAANFHLKLSLGGTDMKGLAAGALDHAFLVVLWVDAVFHNC